MNELITIQPKNNTAPDWGKPFNSNGSLWIAFDADVGFSLALPAGTTKVLFKSTEHVVFSPTIILAAPLIGAPISGTFELNVPVLAGLTLSTIFGYSRTAGDVVVNFYTG